MKLLLIEYDPVIGRALRQGFSEAGQDCVWAKESDPGLALATTQQFGAIVLDLMLPGRPGMEVLKTLRSQGIRTPVVLMSALGSAEERVEGLNAGADDYVIKPFALCELMARIEAVCPRPTTDSTAVLHAGDLTLDLATRRVVRGDREIELTPTEFSLLEVLMRFAGQIVTRKMLFEHLWEFDWEGSTNVVEVHIDRLRGKLNSGFEMPLIEVIRGRGYALRALK